MIKTLITFCLFALACGAYAQDTEVTPEQLREARETMSDIEDRMLRTAEDQNASALILEAKLANEAAYLYLINLPGYQEALANDTLPEYQEEMRKEYKAYKKLHKEARKAQERKQKHIADIDEIYQEAYDVYQEAK